VAAGAAFDVHLALPYYLGTVLCVAAALLLRRRPAAPAPAPSPAEAVKDDQAVS